MSAPTTQGSHDSQEASALAGPGPRRRPLAVKVTVENLAPANGTLLAPIWFGFHDGSFDIYELGTPASAALERLAEDGNAGPLTNAFSASNAGLVQGTLFGTANILNLTAPGARTSMSVVLDGALP